MSSVDSKLYQYAVSTAKEAVLLDSQGKYRQAINKYQRAAEILMQFMKYNKNPQMRMLCQKNIEEYVDRAKILKSQLGGPRTARHVPRPGETGDAGAADSEAGAVSSEEQELIDMISGTIVTESPNINWEDIAGLDNVKQALREAIVLPIAKPELFTGARKPWSGILLFGPPGCGKTLLAKAAATECKATFFSASSALVPSLLKAFTICPLSDLNFFAIRLNAFFSSGARVPLTVPTFIFDSSAVIKRVAGLNIVFTGLILKYANVFAYAISASLSG